MKVTGKGTFYKNQYGWSLSDHQTQKDGTKTKFYIPIFFSKNIKEPSDKTFAEITGYTKPFKYKDGRQSISYVITDYQIENEAQVQTETKDISQMNNSEIIREVALGNIEVDEDPFTLFASEIADEDLPF